LISWTLRVIIEKRLVKQFQVSGFKSNPKPVASYQLPVHGTPGQVASLRATAKEQGEREQLARA
jgi:hypothetical protein